VCRCVPRPNCVVHSTIQQELDVQNQQLNDLEVSVDEVQAHLDKVNDRLGETLKMVRAPRGNFLVI